MALSGYALAEERSMTTALDRMFSRDEPRGFARFPEDVYKYTQESEGLYLQVTSTTVFQTASDSLTERDSLLNTAYSFGGGLAFADTMVIIWWFRGGRPLDASRNADLSKDIGSILDVNGSLESDDFYLRELYWAWGTGGPFRLSLGFVDSSYRYDFNRMANDESGFFLSGSLINSPSIPFPESNLAVDAFWRLTPTVSMHTGVYQTDCEEFDCFDALGDGNYLFPVEVVIRKPPGRWGKGNYRFLAYYTDTRGNSGSGASISFDQEIGDWVPFLRASVADSAVAPIKRFLSLGIGYEAPFSRPWDRIAIGFARGTPSDSSKRTETLVELFWLFQLNPYVAITPDVQIVFDPADNPGKDRVTVLGVRLQLDF